MKARMVSKVVYHLKGSKKINKTEYHLILDGDSISYCLPQYQTSPLSEVDGEYVIAVKGKLSEDGKEIIREIAYQYNLPNPFFEDEGLDLTSDSE